MGIVVGAAIRIGLAAVVAVVCAACGGAPSRSVDQFGAATAGFAVGMSETAAGSEDVCADKLELQRDWDAAVGTPDAKKAFEELTTDKCRKFRETAVFYARLARQLGSFGLAMRTLAEAGDRDYAAEVSDLEAAAKSLSVAGVTPDKVKAASKLGTTIVRWASQGYARSQIGNALLESETSVSDTFELLGLVLKAYEKQVDGYALEVKHVSEDPEFGAKAAGETDFTVRQKRQAQLSIVERHAKRVLERRQVLEKTREALDAVREVHAGLLKEAKAGKKTFDVPQLLARARDLHAKVDEFRGLVARLAAR